MCNDVRAKKNLKFVGYAKLLETLPITIVYLFPQTLLFQPKSWKMQTSFQPNLQAFTSSITVDIFDFRRGFIKDRNMSEEEASTKKTVRQ